jgi:hypothetical protein
MRAVIGKNLEITAQQNSKNIVSPFGLICKIGIVKPNPLEAISNG